MYKDGTNPQHHLRVWRGCCRGHPLTIKEHHIVASLQLNTSPPSLQEAIGEKLEVEGANEYKLYVSSKTQMQTRHLLPQPYLISSVPIATPRSA